MNNLCLKFTMLKKQVNLDFTIIWKLAFPDIMVSLQIWMTEVSLYGKVYILDKQKNGKTF